MTEEAKKLIQSVIKNHNSIICVDFKDYVLKSEFDRVVEELTKWNKVTQYAPLAWETGNWDGKRSNVIICKDLHGIIYIARVYEAEIDGEYCREFAELNDFIIKDVVEWKYIY